MKKVKKKNKKSKTFFAFLKQRKVEFLILWFLVKRLYFQNLRLKILKLKISQAFSIKWRGDEFIFCGKQDLLRCSDEICILCF